MLTKCCRSFRSLPGCGGNTEPSNITSPFLIPLPIWFATLLHSSKLSFRHPIGNKPMTFESELPDDLKLLKNMLSGI